MNEITLTKQNYFSSPIYHMYKPEWISDLNNLSDIEIEKAKQRDKAVFNVRNQKFK